MRPLPLRTHKRTSKLALSCNLVHNLQCSSKPQHDSASARVNAGRKLMLMWRHLCLPNVDKIAKCIVLASPRFAAGGLISSDVNKDFCSDWQQVEF